MKRKLVVTALLITLTASVIMSGCGKKAADAPVTGSGSSVITSATEEYAFTDDELEALDELLLGIDDISIMQGTDTFDLNMGYEEAVVRDMDIRKSNVDPSVTGKYEIYFTVSIDPEAFRAYLKGTLKLHDESTWIDSGKTMEVDVMRRAEVVDAAKAAQLVADGGEVYGYDAEAAAAAQAEAEAAAQAEADAQADADANANNTDNSNTNTSKPSANKNNNSSGTGSSGNSGSSNSAPASSAPANQHVHNWVENGSMQEVVVQDAWDEPVKTTVDYYRCKTCGYMEKANPRGCSDYFIDNHVVGGCGGSYEVVSVEEQTGTIHHDAVTELRWVGSGTYTCSECGATK